MKNAPTYLHVHCCLTQFAYSLFIVVPCYRTFSFALPAVNSSPHISQGEAVGLEALYPNSA